MTLSNICFLAMMIKATFVLAALFAAMVQSLVPTGKVYPDSEMPNRQPIAAAIEDRADNPEKTKTALETVGSIINPAVFLRRLLDQVINVATSDCRPLWYGCDDGHEDECCEDLTCKPSKNSFGPKKLCLLESIF